MADPQLPPGFLLVDPNRIDRRTGAPADVRAAVGAAQTPEGRLSTLRKYAPQAQPYGDDNFLYPNPATGRQTLYNPKGLDFGDVASVLPEYGEFAGGTLGGMLAALPCVAGVPVTGGASLALVPAGIGLGAAGGREAVTAYANRFMGTDDTRGLGQRLGDTALTAGTNAIGANVNMPTLQEIADLGADEQVWQYAMGEAAKGGSRLLRLRQNFQPDEWRTVAATVFDRLAQASPGARGAAELGGEAHDFSVSAFMTNWNKLSSEAKDALFGGPGMKEAREAIDQLVRVANRVKDVERMSNPSGTARGMLTGGSIALAGERALSGDIGGAAGVLASTTALPYVTAKMMTNPTFVRWLAGAETFGKGASRDAMIGRLAAVAEANPEIRDEVLRFQQQLRPSPAPVK
jgi:hypothetical protein